MYDAVGYRTGTTDPLGATTVVTPNALNLPARTTYWQNGGLLDATTTTYDVRSNPQLRTIFSGTLTRRYDPFGDAQSSAGSGTSMCGFAGEQTYAT